LMGRGKIYLMPLLCLNYLNCNLQDRKKKKNSSNKKKKFDSVIRNPIGKKQQQLSVKKEKNRDKAKIIKQMNLSCFEALNSWRGILHFVHKFGSTQIIREIKWCEHTCT